MGSCQYEKKYDIEIERNNVTPRQFFTYCRNQMQKKGLDIETWVDYEEWINPTVQEKAHINKHSDWDEPLTENVKIMPYDIHLYLQNTYNFMMEFEFDDDKVGHGYLYATEYE